MTLANPAPSDVTRPGTSSPGGAVSDDAAATAALAVSGMDCASCVATVERAAKRLDGVQVCDVNLARGRAVVRFDPRQVDPARIAAAITDAGYPTGVESTDGDGATDAAHAEHARLQQQMLHARAWLRRAVVAIVLWLPLEAAHWTLQLTGGHAHGPGGVSWVDWISLVTSTVAIAFVGAAFYRSAWRAARRGTSNMDTLIAMGASVAYLYSLVALLGHLVARWPLPNLYFLESTGLLALISLGHWLEARAREKAGSAIRELLGLVPTMALRMRGREDGGSRMEDGKANPSPSS